MLQRRDRRRPSTMPSSAIRDIARRILRATSRRIGFATTARQSLALVAMGGRTSDTLVSLRTRRHRSGSPVASELAIVLAGRSTIPWSRPMAETIWQRIPPNAPGRRPYLGRPAVVSIRSSCSRKVQVINDLVEDHPFLIVVNPFARPDKAVSIFEADAGRPPRDDGRQRLFPRWQAPAVRSRDRESLGRGRETL